MTIIPDKCSIGPGSEDMGSNLGLVLGTALLVDPRRYWKMIEIYGGSTTEHCCNFPDLPYELS